MIFSQDWYLGGINNLEVIGGPQEVGIREDGREGYSKWAPLILRDTENYERNSCGPHYRNNLEAL